MPFRFVHAADIHLDSPLRSLALRDPALAELVGTATRRAFDATVALCLDERVDALLLSGDLYDGDQTSMKTARFLADHLRRLHQAGIATYIIKGNHDSLSRITRELVFPDTVTVFGGRAGVRELDAPGGLRIAVHGISFAQPHAPESLLAKFRPPVPGAVNIGLLHTSLGGSPGHDPYAPCDVADLQRSGFRYWALGHIHKRSVVEGAATVVMPGIPQGRDIGEAGAGSVTLATVADDGTITLEERATGVAQFARVEVALDGVEDMRALTRLLGEALGRARDGVMAEELIARLCLTGETPLAWQLRRAPEVLRTESEAAAPPHTWIDKVELSCRPPRVATPGATDPLEELRRLMDELSGDPGFQAEVLELTEGLRKQLPAECREAFGTDEASMAAVAASATREGIEDVLARLRGGPPAAG